MTLGELLDIDGTALADVEKAARVVQDNPFAWLILQAFMLRRAGNPEYTVKEAAETSMADLVGDLGELGVFDLGNQ